jgi:NADPH:quinone reductase-like Zn-dependent oxidoreductase
MPDQIPSSMKAIAIDQFGGVEELKLQDLPVPKPGPDDVLIRIDTAGVGVWDPPDREGVLQKMRDTEAHFPYILGRDGSGIVEAVGDNVSNFNKGDRVYVFGPPDPEANLYAEYAVEKAENVSLVPKNLNLEDAGALATDAVTAFCGLNQVLELQDGDQILIFGASGGLGHIAVQLARLMGAEIFAVASGDDGVNFVRKLGADKAVNGKDDDIDISGAIEDFAPKGFDAALVTVDGEAAEPFLQNMRMEGCVAYPHGVDPEPKAPEGIKVQAYSGEVSPEIFETMNNLIESGSFRVHIDRMFPLKDAAEAHRALDDHYLGRLALKVQELGE